MKTLIFCLSLFLPVLDTAYAIDKCKIIKKSEMRLKKNLESLKILRKVHQDQIEAR